jgi:hypothetical protein
MAAGAGEAKGGEVVGRSREWGEDGWRRMDGSTTGERFARQLSRIV